MKKTIKYSLIFLALLVALLVAIPFFIDANTFKPQIAKAVEDATGRKLHIGNIKASFFPWVGVSLDDVRLSNRKGFTDRDFMRVESLDIQVALIPLLSERYEIKEFALNRPELFLERNAEGAGNWEDLSGEKTSAEAAQAGAGAGAGAAQAEPAASSMVALQAEALRLNEGRFIWLDAVTGARLELSELQVDVDDLQLERPVEVNISAKLGEDALRIEAKVGPLGDPGKIDLLKVPVQASLKSEGIALKPFRAWLPELPELLGRIDSARLRTDMQLEQRPTGLRVSAGWATLLADRSLHLNWKAEMDGMDRLRLHEAAARLGDQALMSAQGEIGFGRELKYQLRVQSGEISRTWLANLFPEVESMYAAHPSPWKRISAGALLAGTTERVELRDVQLKLDEELVVMSGVAALGSAPDVRLRLSANQLHLDPWLPQPAATTGTKGGAPQKKGAASTDAAKAAATEPDLRFMTPWKVSGQIQVADLRMRGLQMTDLRASLNGSKGQFNLDPLRFDLSGGQVSERASLDIRRYPASWTESVHITGVRIGPVLKALADMDMLEGTLQLDTDLKATGLLPENAMKSLNGRGNFVMRDGSVKGFDIAGTMRNLTSPAQQQGPKQTDFAQLSGSFILRKGVASNSDLFMASPLFRLTGEGIVNLPAGTLDYHVKPRLVGTLVGQGDTVTVRKGLTVPLHIRGPFASPKITPEIDPATLVEGLKGAVEGKQSPAEALKGILQGGTAPKTEPAPKKKPAESAPPQPLTPQEMMKKRLEGLLPAR